MFGKINAAIRCLILAFLLVVTNSQVAQADDLFDRILECSLDALEDCFAVPIGVGEMLTEHALENLCEQLCTMATPVGTIGFVICKTRCKSRFRNEPIKSCIVAFEFTLDYCSYYFEEPEPLAPQPPQEVVAPEESADESAGVDSNTAAVEEGP